MSGNGFNEAILFHLIHGINGFGVKEYVLPGLILFLYFLSCIAITLFLNKRIYIDTKKNLVSDIIILFITCLALLLNPLLKDIKSIFFSSSTDSYSEMNDFYNKPIMFTKKPDSIIFLYLEQLERTYLDETIFPNLTPNLKRLEKKAISFTNISSPLATNWTIAGMVASQCGIPLLTPIASENSMAGMDKFLSSATCIGDILNNNSYNLNYIGGSDLDFAGKGKFYDSHGFKSVQGWYELEDRLIDKSYKSPWGLYDDSLYEIIDDRLMHLKSSNQAFGLFALTLDTHHPNGYIANSCKDRVYGDGMNLILNSVHCADFMAANFIEKIINDDMFEDTILVVLSDHLALKNTASALLQEGDRKNLFYIFKKDAPNQSINKIGSMFDVTPTVLSLVGTDILGLGLGRNLFFENSLSNNEIGIENIVSRNRNKILSLWSFPQIDMNFNINIQNKKINFGERSIDLPALILLDNNNKVEEIMFDFYNANPLPRKVNELDDKQSFIWVDTCLRIKAFKNLTSVKETPDFCSLVGIKGKQDFKLFEDLTYLTDDLIFQFFSDTKESFFNMN
ncbi:MAG: sulfatase-like hydrolase/transferase [Flavobacteriaceae bacterium]|nr:sulfatase-like hydrolase/transferase [Flavobacteriaceae bacterium]